MNDSISAALKIYFLNINLSCIRFILIVFVSIAFRILVYTERCNSYLMLFDVDIDFQVGALNKIR